jgi:hypothetical protein
MKNLKSDESPKEKQERFKPLAELKRASISLLWVDSGFLATEPKYLFLSSMPEHTIFLGMHDVSTTHFASRQTLDSRRQLFSLLSDMSTRAVGMHFASKSGYWWFVSDVEAYSKLCDRYGFRLDDFQLYPKVDI